MSFLSCSNADPGLKELLRLPICQLMSSEMRRYPRFPVGLVGTLEMLDHDGRGLAYGVRISDVSQGGLGLTLGGPVEVGARVRVQVDGGVLTGVVAHCRQGVGHYCAGIAIEHDSGSLSRLGWMAILHPPRPSNAHT